MGKSKYNWERRDILSLGSKVRFDTNNPQMGANGSDVYDVYGVTEENNQCVVGLSEGGKFSVYNDRDIEIVGGNKDSSEGVDVIITGMSGDVTITAMRNGAVKIKGKNIVIEADEDVDIKAGRNINLNAKQRVLLKATRCDAKGLLGNLIPDKKKFGPQVFEGSFVGFDFLSSMGMIPLGLPNVLGTASDIAMGAFSGAASGGIGGIVQGAANLATNNLTKNLPIDKVADVAIHAMQDPVTAAVSLGNIITDVGENPGYGSFGESIDNEVGEISKLANEGLDIDDDTFIDGVKEILVNDVLNDTLELS
jgi:hypothetical protein